MAPNPQTASRRRIGTPIFWSGNHAINRGIVKEWYVVALFAGRRRNRFQQRNGHQLLRIQLISERRSLR